MQLRDGGGRSGASFKGGYCNIVVARLPEGEILASRNGAVLFELPALL